MVISECNGQAETQSEEDVCFDSHSASDPWGPEAEIFADANCCFNGCVESLDGGGISR